ncbi:hypothetical protein B5807_03352 [Epicoccum nigrum]|uniref:Small ribosomal subunit protein mS38 n=1 Tax=Epicoccum nigrum TaxID=105696 RepID=A0A1Y2M7L7_EPING|nr:hypothetical protein B5807_03352 [Epicoccum nigrum]
MFSPALGRAFRSTSAITVVPASSVGRAAISTAQQPFRTTHQRRLSSSKPSTPPSNPKRPTGNAAEESNKQSAPAAAEGSNKLKASSASAPAAVRNIPHVKPTDYLMEHRTSLNEPPCKLALYADYADLVLHTLFSQHRPISISPAAEQYVPMAVSMKQFEAIFQPSSRNESAVAEQSVPIATSMEQFESIFQQPLRNKSVSMEQFEAIFQPPSRNKSDMLVHTHNTLADFIQGVQATAEQYEAMDILEEEAEAAEAAEETYHLDSFAPAQIRSLESHSFRPPPAPVPFDPLATEEAHEISLPTTHTGRSKTFREHVRRRRSGMLLISVKRQRKLKMKKHKYKKLMKRTRLLRRKLDRL